MDLPSDWQTTTQKISQRGQYLLKTGQWSDCKFIVGQEPSQQILEGHKVFLAMSSPVFEAMLYGTMAEENQPIPILDIQPEAFKALLEYIYTDKLELGSFELACELCYCAKKYMLPFLVEECTKFLWSDLTLKTACRAFEFAKLFDESVLMQKCLQIICSETEDVLKEPSWEDVEQGTILALLDQEELKISSEIDLFNALERWAKAECGRKLIDTLDTKALKSVIGNALTKIRFLTLTPQEFAEGPGKSLLLTQEEAFSILMNISSDKSKVPMPQDFSTKTRVRSKLKAEENQLVRRKWPSLDLFDGPDLARSAWIGMMNARPKLYCKRSLVPSSDFICPNHDVMKCSVTFNVDRNIFILGVKVPTQVLSVYKDLIFSGDLPIKPISSIYEERLNVCLLDKYGYELICVYYTKTINASVETFVEILFDEPVSIKNNTNYEIRVLFKKPGFYPTGVTYKNVISENVMFSFNSQVDHPSDLRFEYLKSGLIRSIVFSYFDY